MSKPLPPIALKDLSHSLKACHRVEDAIWARLGCTERSSEDQVCAALDALGSPPAWCAVEAWERIAESMRGWAAAHGGLQTYWQLRRKRDE